MLAADHIVDIGPGAGSRGGEVVAQGTAEEIMQVEESVTGQYLSGKLQIPVPKTRRKPRGWLTVKGAEENRTRRRRESLSLGTGKDIPVPLPSGNRRAREFPLKYVYQSTLAVS